VKKLKELQQLARIHKVGCLLLVLTVGAHVRVEAKKKCCNHQTRYSASRRPGPARRKTPGCNYGKRKKWSIVIFMIGDEHLIPAIDYNKMQLEFADPTEDLYLTLVTCVYEKIGHDQVIRRVRYFDVRGQEAIPLTTRSSDEVLRSAHAERHFSHVPILETALKFAHAKNAAHYGAILSMHSHGPIMPLGAGQFYKPFLQDREIFQAFKATVTEECTHGHCHNCRWGRYNLVGLDACHMSTVEIAEFMQKYTHYIVASAHSIRTVGWPYHLIFSYYEDNKEPAQLAKIIISAYGAYYGALIDDYTLSAIDLTTFHELRENVEALAQRLQHMLARDDEGAASIAAIIENARSQAARFDTDFFIDLYSWYGALSTQLRSEHAGISQEEKEILQAILQRGIEYFETSGAIELMNSAALAGIGGIAIYLPADEKLRYDKQFWIEHIPQWLKFLEEYLSSRKQLSDQL